MPTPQQEYEKLRAQGLDHNQVMKRMSAANLQVVAQADARQAAGDFEGNTFQAGSLADAPDITAAVTGTDDPRGEDVTTDRPGVTDTKSVVVEEGDTIDTYMEKYGADPTFLIGEDLIPGTSMDLTIPGPPAPTGPDFASKADFLQADADLSAEDARLAGKLLPGGPDVQFGDFGAPREEKFVGRKAYGDLTAAERSARSAEFWSPVAKFFGHDIDAWQTETPGAQPTVEPEGRGEVPQHPRGIDKEWTPGEYERAVNEWERQMKIYDEGNQGFGAGRKAWADSRVTGGDLSNATWQDINSSFTDAEIYWMISQGLLVMPEGTDAVITGPGGIKNVAQSIKKSRAGGFAARPAPDNIRRSANLRQTSWSI